MSQDKKRKLKFSLISLQQLNDDLPDLHLPTSQAIKYADRFVKIREKCSA